MPLNKVKELLNAHGTKYVAISHSKAYTAQGIAAISHVSGKELAKAVIVNLTAIWPWPYCPRLSRLIWSN